ncbi:protoheme IX farnesyltransferase [Sporobolomyces salmoneus]|uniref:protoheme IX farnesyltransferase n=1 Tax=Sporobolomyces salmoneus TaxID=183962 RepID=UPI0031704B94
MLSRAIPSTSRGLGTLGLGRNCSSSHSTTLFYSTARIRNDHKGKQREIMGGIGGGGGWTRYNSTTTARSENSPSPTTSTPSLPSPSSHNKSRRAPSFFTRSYRATTIPKATTTTTQDDLPSTSHLVPFSSPPPRPLPPSLLSNGLPNPSIRWRPRPQTSIQQDIDLYKQLGKFKLSSLVVLTTMAGYAMCPVDPSVTSAAVDAFAQSLSSSSSSLSSTSESLLSSLGSSPANNLTLSVLLPTTVGTTLCAFSAASFNQLIESPYDSQMTRTRSRPLPKRLITPLHSFFYGTLTGSLGLTTLYFINPLSSFLGLFTILLYCPLYTISKRHSIYNTWIGSIVGSIPPLIGWAACTDSLDPITQPGAWALFGLMFAWQFPHFMSLAHTLRSSYASSGYRMLSVLDPTKNALVSLRYSLALLPLCASFPALGLTNGWFGIVSLIPNGLMAICAWRFYRATRKDVEGEKRERRAKELFWSSLVHLPVVLVMMLLMKKGLWGPDEEEEEEGVVVKKEKEEEKVVVGA